MTCDVELTPTAEDDLDRLDTTVADRVIAKLRWLAENADTVRVETLSGRWRGVCKCTAPGFLDTRLRYAA